MGGTNNLKQNQKQKHSNCKKKKCVPTVKPNLMVQIMRMMNNVIESDTRVVLF